MSDLASILLSERIIYLGMALASDDETRQSFSSGMNVTQLMVAQLLCLEFDDNEAPITIYINSTGSTDINSNAIGHETEAFAIYDTMRFIKAPVHTFCIGVTMGTATMLLAAGKRGKRASLPNASIILNQPYNYVAGSSTEINLQVEQLLLSRSIMHEGVDLFSEARIAGVSKNKLNELVEKWKSFRNIGLLLVEGERWRLSEPHGVAICNKVLRDMMLWWYAL